MAFDALGKKSRSNDVAVNGGEHSLSLAGNSFVVAHCQSLSMRNGWVRMDPCAFLGELLSCALDMKKGLAGGRGERTNLFSSSSLSINYTEKRIKTFVTGEAC